MVSEIRSFKNRLVPFEFKPKALSISPFYLSAFVLYLLQDLSTPLIRQRILFPSIPPKKAVQKLTSSTLTILKILEQVLVISWIMVPPSYAGLVWWSHSFSGEVVLFFGVLYYYWRPDFPQ